MRQIIECVPNISEGRRQPVIDAILAAVRGAGVEVLDLQSDPEQNRSVLRFAGSPVAVERAALALAAAAVERIDVSQHEGRHPRVGAVDVMPFVPVSGTGIEACVEMARRVGRRMASELKVPVYLYAEAATSPERRELAALREGQYEGLVEAIATDPQRAPDFGPKRMGKAGAAIVGARHPRVHVLVRLAGQDPEPARRLASALDGDRGGFASVEARAISDESGIGVGLHLNRIDQTPLHRVLALLRLEAEDLGLAVGETEFVGLLPQRVLLDAGARALGLANLRPDQIIEQRIDRAASSSEAPSVPSVSRSGFVDAVAEATPTPGGGSVAAYAGALGAALSGMVASLTLGRPKYEAVEADMQALADQSVALRGRLMELVEEDASAFERVMEAYRMPRDTGDDASRRRDAVQAALRASTAVPLEVMRQVNEVLDLASIAASKGNASAVSDAGVGAHLALAAARGAALNVEINVMGLRDLEEGDRYRNEANRRLKDAEDLAAAIDQTVRARISG